MERYCNPCSIYSSKANTALLLLAYVLLFLLPFPCNSQQLLSVLLNSSAVGTTINAPIALFTKFQTLDIRKPRVGLGGQRLFQLQIPSELSDTDITISTCQGSNFDTYVALLDANPELQQNASALSESDNDINCETGRNKAFLTTRLSPGQYFILVTGNGKQEGNFTISVKGASATPPPIPWGLDRIDQRRLPLDSKYDVKPSGGRVWVYLIDSGVRTSHEEFEGRAQDGYDFVNNKEASTPDCTGHGTHVAGIIAGKTYGVSKQVRLVSVRAFDCNNTARVSAIVDALGWSLIDTRFKERTNVVIAMMFSTATVQSSVLQSAIIGLQRSGIPVVVPAGNNGEDACKFYPASIGAFLTVGSTASDDARSQFSNFGNCTKLYAPGASIVSSWHNSDKSWRSFSGTAQAAAHVTGVVSNLMNLNPRIKAEMVYNIIESVSTLDKVGNVPAGESTRLAFVRSVPEFTGSIPPPEKEVYLFMILRIELSTCSEESEEITKIKTVFAEELGIESWRIVVTCRTENKAGSNADSRLIQVRFQMGERRAIADFTLLENLVVLGVSAFQLKLGLSFEVVEEPWVVDSTLTVFWGAPTFSETESSRSLSSGAIGGICVGVFFLVSTIVVICCVGYRRYAKLDVIESMEGSADFEKGPVTFQDFEEESRASSMMMRSFRNVVRMSMRKSGTMRKSRFDGTEVGINRMGSYIGGGRENIGKDLVRVESYGGEAFAGLLSVVQRSSRDIGKMLKRKSGRIDLRASFRGENNVVVGPRESKSLEERSVEDGFDDEDEAKLDESLRMRSVDGEAFAMMGREGSLESRKFSDAGERKTGIDRVAKTESYGREALADDEKYDGLSEGGSSDHGSSFFGDK